MDSRGDRLVVEQGGDDDMPTSPNRHRHSAVSSVFVSLRHSDKTGCVFSHRARKSLGCLRAPGGRPWHACGISPGDDLHRAVSTFGSGGSMRRTTADIVSPVLSGTMTQTTPVANNKEHVQ